MKAIFLVVIIGLLGFWLFGAGGKGKQHLDSNGCHTSPRSGIYHCHSNGEPHTEDEAAAAFAEAEATYLPPGVAPAGAPQR